MFDNVLHQAKAVELLSNEVSSRTLPASLLFHGPRYSAKLTAALETARALSCLKDGAWSCACEHCRTHRTLDYPWLVLAGPKPMLPEIEAAAGLLKLHRTEPRRFFLLRAVKKLLKRFDPVLWEGDENKLKGAAVLATLQDDLETLYPPSSLAGELVLDRIVESCRTLADTLPSGGLPIHQVRKISTWARTTSSGAPKFVIFENADRMQEGARNALLKILEEPPVGTWFFLLTSQKGAVMPTILSRLRPFAFSARTTAEEQEILSGLFQAEPGAWNGLEDYFQAFETQKQGLFSELANSFLEGLTDGIFPLESYSKFWAEEENYSRFLKALAENLVADQNRPLRQRERLFRLVHEALTKRETYNLSAPLLIETLFYQCRSAE